MGDECRRGRRKARRAACHSREGATGVVFGLLDSRLRGNDIVDREPGGCSAAAARAGPDLVVRQAHHEVLRGPQRSSGSSAVLRRSSAGLRGVSRGLCLARHPRGTTVALMVSLSNHEGGLARIRASLSRRFSALPIPLRREPPYAASGSPSPSSASTSLMRSTETTFSPSAVRNTRTPLLARLVKRMPPTGTRMSWAPSEISMMPSLSSTGKAATRRPISAVLLVSVALMPLPPRLEMRNS